MSVRKSPEAQIQRAVIQHLKARAVPGLVYFHVPNGGSRGKIEAAKFKAMGVRAGRVRPDPGSYRQGVRPRTQSGARQGVKRATGVPIRDRRGRRPHGYA
jgi:hypothetical protein